MHIIEKLFIDHPSSVDETYFEHMQMASSFGISMVLGGLACIVHGLLPFAFETTGSKTIRRLHGRMVANRVRQAPASDTVQA